MTMLPGVGPTTAMLYLETSQVMSTLLAPHTGNAEMVRCRDPGMEKERGGQSDTGAREQESGGWRAAHELRDRLHCPIGLT
jgi:hypothetical protein